MSGQIVTIATIQHSFQADVLRTVLESNGIECFLPNENMSSIRPELMSSSGGIQLQVRDTDAVRAMQILEQHSSATEPPSDENPDSPQTPEERPRVITLPILIFIMIVLFLILWQFLIT